MVHLLFLELFILTTCGGNQQKTQRIIRHTVIVIFLYHEKKVTFSVKRMELKKSEGVERSVYR